MAKQYEGPNPAMVSYPVPQPRSESEREVALLKGQLDCFAAAQELREEKSALQAELMEAYATIARLKAELAGLRNPGGAPFLKCPCCDEQLAPADYYSPETGWNHELDKAFECNQCGARSIVAEGAGGKCELQVLSEVEDELDDMLGFDEEEPRSAAEEL